jgi:hypothetical protein
MPLFPRIKKSQKNRHEHEHWNAAEVLEETIIYFWHNALVIFTLNLPLLVLIRKQLALTIINTTTYYLLSKDNATYKRNFNFMYLKALRMTTYWSKM